MWIKLTQVWNTLAVGTELNVSEDEGNKLVTDGIAETVDAPTKLAADAGGDTDATDLQQQLKSMVGTIVQQVTSAVPDLVQKQIQDQLRGAADKSDDPDVQKVLNAGAGDVELGADRIDPTFGFETYSEFAVAVAHACRPGRAKIDERLIKHAASGMSEGDDAGGGFLVPPQHMNTLLKLAYGRSVIYSKCRFIPMQTNQIDMPVLMNTDRRKGYRNGGVQVYWVAEAGQKTASRPKFGKVGLKLNELAGLVYVTETLLEDSPISLEPLLNEVFADEFAIEIDDALLFGTGAGQPLGVLNAPCLGTVAKEGGQAAVTIVSQNIMKMWSRLWGPSKSRSAWYINSDCMLQLQTMTINVGTGGHALWMPANGLASKENSTLYGRPVVEVENMQTLGTEGDILLADFGYYLVGQKSRSLKRATSIHLRFDYDEVAFRYVMRIDGQPWLDDEIQPMRSADTKSPFVDLAVRE